MKEAAKNKGLPVWCGCRWSFTGCAGVGPGSWLREVRKTQDSESAEMTRVGTAPEGGWMGPLERLEMTVVGHRPGCAQGVGMSAGAHLAAAGSQGMPPSPRQLMKDLPRTRNFQGTGPGKLARHAERLVFRTGTKVAVVRG